MLLGATNASFGITNVQLSAGGSYAVRVMNGFGTVMSSNALLTVQILASLPATSPLSYRFVDGAMQLSFPGIPGAKYSIQASTNLVDWTVIGVATDHEDGTFEYIDTSWNNLPACFYRVVESEPDP